ncbi:MAG: choice-of-anchor L domain-containing protein, partial [Saprospiraceae bacterium]|nr:choice-of-anchor L domain-containing protein [Saprospiraceae bacterium]
MRPIFQTIVVLAASLLCSDDAASQNPTIITLEGPAKRVQLQTEAMSQTLQVCGLELGKNYQIWVAQGQACQPSFSFGNQTYHASQTFQAAATCFDIEVSKSSESLHCAKAPIWLSIGCTDCAKNTASPFQKIAVTQALSPDALLNDIFIGGECYDVDNITAIGQPAGRGNFTNGTSSINIANGIVLSTGDVTLAEGPNNSDGISSNIGGPIFDADLEQLSGLDVYDVQGIEFDFVPTSNTVSFQYVFASEEYCEYVNQGASDHFGFFISGPGINGGFSSNGQNIATVPTTNLHVSIDNVSHLTNSAYFFPNRANCGGTTNMVDIQYDGWTSVLTASANVVPCQTYRIRLVIADVLDGIFDSAVFLSAGSFSAGGNPAQGELSASAGPTLVFENCNDGSFTFTRAPGSNDTEPLPINLTLLPSSTAELGLDFDPFPLTATIPAGANSVSIPVNVLPDNLNEGTETINVSVANNCRCNNLVFSLEINDPPALTAVLPDIETCEGTNFALTPSVSGGIPGSTYDYVWSNGQIGQTVTITPVDNQIISVTVTDRCGGSALASTVAEVIEAPSATLTAGGGNTCLEAANEPHELIIEYSGEPDWLLSYSINGIAQAPILATASPYTLTVNAPGDYVLTGVNSVAGGCPGTAAGEATLYLGDLQNTVLTTAATCSAMGSMSLSTTGGTAPYSYVWSNSAPDSPSANGLAAGTYLVTVTDLNGCSSIATGMVTAALPPAAVAVGSQVDCSADSDGSINLSISNGSAPFDFSWSNGLPNAQQQTGLGIGTYAVTITDAVGCTATATASIVAASTSPIAQAQSLGEIDCENQTTTLSAAGSTTGANIGYAWNGPGIVGQANSLIISAEEGGEYTAVVTDNSSGCSDTASVIVLADLEAPTAFAEGDTINCDNPTAILSGIGSSTGPDFQYEWTGTGTIAGGNTLTPTVTEAGVFTLTVTDENNGCTATATAAVADDVAQPQAVIAAPAQLTCTVSTVVLDGSGSSAGPNFNYQWLLNGSPLPNENSPSLVASSVGVYTLLVENTQNGCAANVEVEVENDTSLPVVAAAADGQLDCSQSTVQLTASFQGDPADFDFAWATVDGSFGSATDGPTTLVNAGGTYTIIIMDVSSGCSSSANVVVNESNDLPNASILPAAPLDCNTGQVQLDASASAQGPGLSFTWATPDGHFFTGENTLAPTVDEAGTYVLTVFDANNNCENQASVTVILDENAPSLNLPAAEMLTCGVTQVSLTSIVGNLPPNAALNYAWTSVDGEIVGAVDGANLLVAAPGTYSLEITNTSNGCSTTALVTVDENVEVPLVNIAPADPITCETAEVTLDASGSSAGSNFSYEWTSPTGSFTSGQSLMNPTVDAAGTYNLLITNILNECTNTGQVLVEASIELPDALANVAAMLDCEVEEVALSGLGSSIGPDFSYAWIGPGITADSTTLEPLVNAPGTYQLTVLNGATGCSATVSVTVGQDLNLPTVAAGMDAEFSCTSVSLTLDGSGSSVGA